MRCPGSDIPWPTTVVADGARVVRFVKSHHFILARTPPRRIVAEAVKVLGVPVPARGA